MKDPYTIDQALKQKTKSKEGSTLQDEIDQEIVKEAERTEEMNYKKAKAARMRLEKSAEVQKGTTEEMKRQGEKITHAKKSALKVHKNAEDASQLADSIERESHMFNIGVPFLGRIKKWWSKDKKEEKEIEAVQNSVNAEDADPEKGASEESETPREQTGEEYIPGQHKTDSELFKILHSVKKINKEASVQSKEASKQKVDLYDINKINEYSKKKVDKTDYKLKKGM